ncbi:hypothetical protein [Niastella koreensis]|nr:hypothetical protein [Niastella koreensis]
MYKATARFWRKLEHGSIQKVAQVFQKTEQLFEKQELFIQKQEHLFKLND